MSLRGAVVVVVFVVTGAGCENQPTSRDSQYSGGATTRCRPDPDDPKTANAYALRDREWEDPNDDGRPTCRSRPRPTLSFDAEPPPLAPVEETPQARDAGQPDGDGGDDGGQSDLAGADGGADGDGLAA